MYRTEETKKILWDKFESDELWPERHKGLTDILQEVVDSPLTAVLAEAYMFGYAHGLGLRRDEGGERDVNAEEAANVATRLLKFIKGLDDLSDITVEFVDDDEDGGLPPVIPA